MNNLDKIISKIQKLLALAESNNPNEAMIAARQARRLMDKHQLTKEDIERKIGTQFLETKAEKKTGKRQTWIRVLCYSAAIMNDCRSILDYSGMYGYGFQGFKSDAIVAKLTLDYFIDACEKACNQSTAKGVSEKNQFRLGFASEVQKRAIAIERERKTSFKSLSTGTGLVPVKMAMIEQHFGSIKTAGKPKTRQPTFDEIEAFSNGAQKGKSLNLDRQVNGKESTKLGMSEC